MEAEKLILQLKADAQSDLTNAAYLAFRIGVCVGAVGMFAISVLAY